MLVIDSGEKEYVFNILDKYNIRYKIEEIKVWCCRECSVLYRIQPTKCECGSKEFDIIKAGDISNKRRSFVIERKKGDNLYSSLHNNEIYDQLERIGSVFEGNACVVFEGNLDVLAKEHPDRSNQLYSIPAACNQYNVSFICIHSLSELAKMLKYFDYKSGKKPKIRRRKHKFGDSYPDAVKTYMNIRGIGKKTALRLFAKYPSPYKLSNDLLKGRMRKVKNVGPATKKMLKSYLIGKLNG